MSTLSKSELAELCKSVEVFSEEAVERAIAEARDPEKAAQLVDRLRAFLRADNDTFPMVVLCIVLGEAGVSAAIPLLLEAAVGEPDFPVQEAAQYALQRMGAPAHAAAMELIETTTDAMQRVLAYEILNSAVDADETTRRQVADFCLNRLDSEFADFEPDSEFADFEPASEWQPFASCAMVSVYLRDKRIRPRLAAMRNQTPNRAVMSTIDDLRDEWRRLHTRRYAYLWRKDWRERCREWYCLYGPDENTPLPDSIAELTEQFVESAFARSVVGMAARETGNAVSFFLEVGWRNLGDGLDPRSLDPVDVEEALFKLMPRKLLANVEAFAELARSVEAFFRFLADRDMLDDPQRFIRLGQRAVKRLPKLADDPRNWGIAKLTAALAIMNAADHAAFDELAEETFSGEIQRLGNSRYDRSLVDRDALDGLAFQPSPPDVQSVKRNAPCPCGSGHKYKKCCGRVRH